MTGQQMAVQYEGDAESAGVGHGGHFAALVVVTPGYFSTLGIRLLAGRDFTDAVRDGGEPVGIVSRRLARVLAPASSAVGSEIRVGGTTRLRIVGVVDDVKGQGLDADAVAALYRPYAQETWLQAPYLAGCVAETQADPRFSTLLLLLASAVAISLAGVGAYGVMRVIVSSRRREYGIRLALGAVRGDILRQPLATGGAPVLVGMVAGLAGARAFTRWLLSLLFGVEQFDPGVLAAAAVVLGLAAWLALYLPARRAAGSDPGAVLRTE